MVNFNLQKFFLQEFSTGIKMVKKITLLSCLLTFATNIFSQHSNLIFNHFDERNDYNIEAVRSITQDSLGFLWIGGNQGLFRYDGYQVKIYQHNYSNPNSLGHSDVKKVYCDRNGDIWVGTFGGGISKYNKNTDGFINFRPNEKNQKSISKNDINAIVDDKYGFLWIGFRKGGLDCYDKKTKCFYHFNHEPGNPNSLCYNDVSELAITNDTLLWIGTWGGGICTLNLNVFIKTLEKAKHQKDTSQVLREIVFEKINTPGMLDKQTVYAVKNLNDSVLLTSLWKNTTKMLLADANHIAIAEQFTERLNPYDNILDFQVVDNSQLWLGTSTGIHVFAYGIDRNQSLTKDLLLNEKFSFRKYVYDLNEKSSLRYNRISCLFADKNQTIWIGTVNGLDYLRKMKFRHYIINSTTGEENRGTNNVVCFNEDYNNNLWISIWEKGLYCYSEEKKQYEAFLPQKNNVNSPLNDQIKTIYRDEKGIFWLGYTEGGVSLFDPISRNFKHYDKIYKSLQIRDDFSVNDFCRDRIGNIWIAAHFGLLRMNLKTDSVSLFPLETANEVTHYENAINCLYAASNGDIWVGTAEFGLYRLQYMADKKDYSIINFRYNYDDTTSLSDNWVKTIYEAKDGTIWIGTNNQGIDKFIPPSKSAKERNATKGYFINYSQKDGIASNVIMAILEDDDRNLWISTTAGLSKLNTRNMTFKNYFKEDGLQHRIFGPQTCFKRKTGELLFGGIHGFNAFYTNEITENTTEPKIIITKFNIFNKPVEPGVKNENGRVVLEKTIFNSDEITLDYDDKIFSLEFSSMDFSAPMRNKYAYRLRGFNDKWIYIDAKLRRATFTNIPNGEYIFEVKGTNSDGVWSKTPTTLKITILSPFWKTPFAIVLYILTIFIVGLAIRLFAVYRTNLINSFKLEKMEREKEQEIYQSKLRFFTNISHEFRNPLTLILAPVKNMIKTLDTESPLMNQAKLIENNAQRLLNLINQLMDFRKIDSEKLTLKATKGNIILFLKDIASHFEIIAHQKSVTFTIQSEIHHINVWFDADLMEKVFEATNYLEFYDSQTQEDFARLENIRELKSVALQFTNLVQFLEQVALVESEYSQGEKTSSSKDGVRLMTLHQAKGLEFQQVFISGVEEGILPHSRSIDDQFSLEEERRLFYVGITRAKENLHITYTRMRALFGRRTYAMKSQFIRSEGDEDIYF